MMPEEKMEAIVCFSPNPRNQNVGRRHVKIREGEEVKVGRASANPAKKMMPAPENTWITSPILSREHAILKASEDKKEIYITDLESTHGTYLNNRKLEPLKDFRIENGEILTFGQSVTSANVLYQPVEFRVESNWHITEINHTNSASKPTSQTEGEFRAPDVEIESSPEPERERSVQILDWTPRRYAAPAITTDTESESDEEDSADIDLTSSVRGNEDSKSSSATTPEHGSASKKNAPTNGPVEGNMSGSTVIEAPRKCSISAAPHSIYWPLPGKTPLNPIDLEVVDPISVDSDSDDDSALNSAPIHVGPGPKPSPLTARNTNQKDGANSDNETRVIHVAKEAQAIDEVGQGSSCDEGLVSEPEVESDLEEESEFNSEMSSCAEVTESEGTNEENNSASAVEEYSRPTAPPAAFIYRPLTPQPSFDNKGKERAASPTRALENSEPKIFIAEDFGVSQPCQVHGYPQLSSEARAPSPSDAALARKADDRIRTLAYAGDGQFYSGQPRSFVDTPDGFPRANDFPILTSPELGPVPYTQGPFSAPNLPSIGEARQPSFPNMEQYQYQCALPMPRPDSIFESHDITYPRIPDNPTERQASKMNISSILERNPVNHTETSRSLKRKANDMCQDDEAENAVFSTAGFSSCPAGAPSPRDFSLPPTPEFLAQEQLPNAQPQKSVPNAEVFSLSQQVRASKEPLLSMSTSLSELDQEAKSSEEPPSKKFKVEPSQPASSGYGKFFSGVCFGLVGAVAAFVATIPASVREEALHEVSKGI